jgi:hypothetical protein
LEEEMRYLEKLSGVTGHLLEQKEALRVRVNEIKKKDESLAKVKELWAVTNDLKEEIRNLKNSDEYASKAKEIFGKIAGEKEVELIGLGKAGLLKMKWGYANAKKDYTEMEQEQQKVFQEAGKAEKNKLSIGSNQNETQSAEGRI